MMYFALGTDGVMYDLGDCEDFAAAKDAAGNLKVGVIWLADRAAAFAWTDRTLKSILGDKAAALAWTDRILRSCTNIEHAIGMD